MWGGIVSARLEDIAGALETAPQAILGAVEREGIEPMLDTAEPKGRGSDRERPTEPELRCLAFTREDFARLVEAIGSEVVAPEAIGDGEEVGAPVQAAR